MQKLWGTAFSKEPSEAVIAFTAGRDVASVPPADEAILPYDIWVNKAHCVMLAKCGIIPKTDAVKILKGLTELENDASFYLDPSKEDVHTNIESYLTKKLGIEVAGKLHTARSRNDQIVTDMRLYLKDQALLFIGSLCRFYQGLASKGLVYQSTPIPGFTHHQHAMVTTLGQVFEGFAAMIVRDIKKFQHWVDVHNTNPLGSVVAYGTTFPIDPVYTSKLLGFDKPAENAMDAITNRWEAEADLAYAIVSLMNHLSTMAQTLILMTTPEFGMIKLSDEFSTGSSIMPQKKNPHPLEVIKGKTSYATGNLMGIVGLGKANFIGYNAESQWTKYLIMDLINECLPAPIVLKGVLETMTVDKEAMAAWCKKAMIGATSLLEQFAASNNIPFRVAKIVVEKAIKYSQSSDTVNYGAILKALKEEKLGVPITRKQVRSWQDPVEIMKATHTMPGLDKNALKEIEMWLSDKKKQIAEAKEFLEEEMNL